MKAIACVSPETWLDAWVVIESHPFEKCFPKRQNLVPPLPEAWRQLYQESPLIPIVRGKHAQVGMLQDKLGVEVGLEWAFPFFGLLVTFWVPGPV